MARTTIVIPALNEKERLAISLPRHLAFFSPEDVSFIVVDNGSTDGTVDWLRELEQNHENLTHLEFARPLGKGGAVYAGFDAAKTPLVGFVDADVSTPPEELDKLIKTVIDSDADIAIASRWLKGARMEPPQPLSRRINGRLFNAFVNLFFGLGLSDTQCGAKVLRREVYETIKSDLRLSGFSFDVELLWRAKKRGFKIKEVPITWRYIPGHSFSPIKGGIKAVVELLRLRTNG